MQNLLRVNVKLMRFNANLRIWFFRYLAKLYLAPTVYRATYVAPG